MSIRLSLGRFLIKTDYVSAGIAKSGGDFWGVFADFLHDLASVGDYQFERFGDAVDHDVQQQAWLFGGRAAQHPRSAHFADAIVEGGGAVAALPDVPAKNLFVKLG